MNKDYINPLNPYTGEVSVMALMENQKNGHTKYQENMGSVTDEPDTNTPPLYRTEYQSVDGRRVEVKTTSLFVWAAVDTKTGKVYVDDIKEFDDELDVLSSGYEWRKFRLVPEEAE